MVNNPNIRFAGFSDEWLQRKLGELYEKGQAGGTPSTTNASYYGGSIPFLSISDVTKAIGEIYDTEKHITSEGLDSSSAWIVPKGAISLSMYASVGKLAILGVNLATSQAFYNMVFSDDSVRNFVYHRLIKAYDDNEWNQFVSTGTQSNLNGLKVKSFEIMCPYELKEQQKIGSILSTLDHKIGLEERQISLLKDLKKGYLQKMFPKQGATEPEIRFVGFADDWEERKLEDIADVKDGKDHGKLSHGDIPMYGTGGYMHGVNKSLSDIDAVGIGHRGTIGKPHILKSPFWAISTLYYAVPHDAIDIKYLMYNLSLVEWRRYNETIAVPTIPKDRVKSTSVNLPSYHEQQKISGLLNVIDEMIDSYSDEISKLEQIKKGLLQQMFV